MRRAAEALETSFLSEMLKSARLYEPSESMDGGAGEEQFTSFLADAHARAMVARGGLGLADAIEQTLIRRQGGTS
jgi:Rod binding domain-containing protein